MAHLELTSTIKKIYVFEYTIENFQNTQNSVLTNILSIIVGIPTGGGGGLVLTQTTFVGELVNLIF